MAWFNDWFGADYLDLYAHRDAAEAAARVDFLAAWWAGRQPRRVLNLACGADPARRRRSSTAASRQWASTSRCSCSSRD